MVVGEVTEVKLHLVVREAVDNLRRIVQKRAEGFPFDCRKCGVERLYDVIDPGVMMDKNLDCSSVGLDCERRKVRPILFVPGSLVLAPIDPYKDSMWPGIIEPCPEWPELTDGHYIPVRGHPNVARAYYVTFITGEDENRKFYGGFIEARLIRPFPEDCESLRIGEGAAQEDFREAVRLATDAIDLSLASRLLQFSVVAQAAEMRNITLTRKRSLSSDNSDSEWQFNKRILLREAMLDDEVEPVRPSRLRAGLDETLKLATWFFRKQQDE